MIIYKNHKIITNFQKSQLIGSFITVNSSGCFEYAFKVNQTGILNINVSYAGNQNYIGSSNQTSIKVNQINTKITSDIQLDTVNNQIFIIGILTDEKNNTLKKEQKYTKH